MNASGHLVALAVDRVLIISDPIWHHGITWRRKIPLISIGMIAFHLILLIPRCLYLQVNDGICGIDAGVYVIGEPLEKSDERNHRKL